MALASRRDWLLQQLGYSQWALHRPGVLRGEVALTLAPDTGLVIVADTLPELTDPVVSDVLRSLGLTASQVVLLTAERAEMLPTDRACNSWALGLDAPLSLPGAKLVSPPLAELYQSGAARRALWQQICENEHDFFPDAR